MVGSFSSHAEHVLPDDLPVQVTLCLQPMFKRSISFVKRDDSDLAEQVAVWGRLHEFGDITWQPEEGKVIYRVDDRVNVSAPGDGFNDNLGFRPFSATELVADRVQGARRRRNCSLAPCTRLLTERRHCGACV